MCGKHCAFFEDLSVGPYNFCTPYREKLNMVIKEPAIM